MPGLQPVYRHGDIVLMGSRQAQPGGQLLMMLCLVLCQRRRNVRRRTQWVLHGFHGLIRQSQLLPFPGALPVGPLSVDGQGLHIPGPVADEHRSHLAQPPVKVGQGVQQLRILVTVPEDAGLVFIQPPVFRQGLGIPGPQLAQGHIHEPPPGRRSLPDEKQVLRREKHRVQHLGQVAAVFGGHTVDGHLPPPSPGQLNLRFKFPFPGPDLSHQPGPVRSEANKLPIRMGPGTAAAGQIHNGLQQVGLFPGHCLHKSRCSFHQTVSCLACRNSGSPPAAGPSIRILTPSASVPLGVPPRRRDGSSCPAWCIPPH